MTNEEITQKMVPVLSSTVHGRYRDPETNTMYILFNSGKIYAYNNISIDEYVSILESGSVGSKLREVVKGKQYTKLN